MFKLYQYLSPFILFLFCFKQMYGQESNCNNMNYDACYIEELFNINSEILIQKQTFFNNEFYSTSIPIITKNINSCEPNITLIENINDDNFLSTYDKDLNVVDRILLGFFVSRVSVNYILKQNANQIQNELILALSPYDVYSNRLIRMNYAMDTLWISDEKYKLTSSSYSYNVNLSVYDINKDGREEIVVYNKIFNAQNGVLLANGGVFGEGGRNSSIVVGEFNGDPSSLELAAGNTVYEIDINNLNGTAGNFITPHVIDDHILIKDGFTSMADVNHDGISDIIVMPEYEVAARPFFYVYTYAGSVLEMIGSIRLPLVPPNDIDRSTGRPIYGKVGPEGKEGILVTTKDSLRFITYDGTKDLKQEWAFYLEDRHGGLSPTLFDLNGDGENEIIYKGINDLVILNVMDNKPEEIYRTTCKSASNAEHPIVADIDNDGEAEICTICEDENGDGRLTIFSSPEDGPPWAPARAIWNQYGYHVLNINDDMTVPQYMENNATYMDGKYNNFMVQESLLGEDGMVQYPAASIYGEIGCIDYDVEDMSYHVSYVLYNKEEASKSTSDSLVISYYDGDPYSGGDLIDTVIWRDPLLPGDSVEISLEIDGSTLTDRLFFLINAENLSGDYIDLECDYTDNLSQALGFPVIEELSEELCGGSAYDFYGTMLSEEGSYHYREQNQEGCDSLIVLLDLEVTEEINTALSPISCESYEIDGDILTESGSYTYDYTSVSGCDSIVTLDLTIHEPSITTAEVTECESYDWNGATYTESGTYEYQSLNQNGCDSVATLELEINESIEESLTVGACDTYDWNGENYTESGSYTYDGLTIAGCDSIITLDLTISDVIELTESVVTCESYEIDDDILMESGNYTYNYTSTSGCDSIVTLDLTIHEPSSTTAEVTECESYQWNGATYTESGTYKYESLNQYGCDSIATLELEINENIEQSITVGACDSYDWNGVTYTESGLYTYDGVTSAGCDSIVKLDLTISDVIELSESVVTCESYEIDGDVLTESGIFTYDYTSTSGCDSIVTLDLTIHELSSTTAEVSECENYNWNGATYTESGTYEYESINQYGCDSIAILELELSNNITETVVEHTCEEYEWNDVVYKESGLYTYDGVTSAGCDSMVTLDLTISDVIEIEEMAIACDAYEMNGITYEESGSYNSESITAEGCDSIHTLELLIFPSYLMQDTVETSEPYHWVVNGETYNESGVYEERYETIYGCDSLYQLILLIDVSQTIDFPNVFQPGYNQVFTIYGSQIMEVTSFTVYDRWGNIIYDQEGPKEKAEWDGKIGSTIALPGVYVWKTNVILKDGSPKVYVGDVTVVRL